MKDKFRVNRAREEGGRRGRSVQGEGETGCLPLLLYP